MPHTKNVQTTWVELARCRGAEDDLFPEGKQQKRAAAICVGCPVRVECLIEALDNRLEWGIWGGLTERERRALLRKHPEVKSWREVLSDQASHLFATTEQAG